MEVELDEHTNSRLPYEYAGTVTIFAEPSDPPDPAYGLPECES